MMMHRHWLVSIGLVCAACSGDDSTEQPPPPDSAPDATPDAPPTGSVTFDGSVVGPAPATAHVIGFWGVEVGQDHFTKYGDGNATATTFNLTFPASVVPDDALNVIAPAKFGVGVPVLVNATEAIPDGPIIKEFPILGFSTQYAIIYRTGDVPADSPFVWINAFPSGDLTCGKCVRSGGTFDSYAPVQCSELVLDAATDPSTLEGCNWI